MKDRRHWSGREEKTSSWGLNFLLKLYRLTGRGFIVTLLYPIVGVYWLKEAGFRTESHRYLTRCYRYGLLKNAPNTFSSYRHLLFFAQTMLDKLIFLAGHGTQTPIVFEGLEPVDDLIAQKKGILFATSHMGCIEALQAWGDKLHTREIVALVYQQHSQEFTRILRQINPLVHIDFIDVAELTPQTAMLLEEKLERGALVFVAADRVPQNLNNTVRLPFLGQEAAFPIGAVVLANLFHCPLFALNSRRVKTEQGTTYAMTFTLLSEGLHLSRQARKKGIESIMLGYIKALEANIEKSPLDWSNFYDYWQ